MKFPPQLVPRLFSRVPVRDGSRQGLCGRHGVCASTFVVENVKDPAALFRRSFSCTFVRSSSTSQKSFMAVPGLCAYRCLGSPGSSLVPRHLCAPWLAGRRARLLDFLYSISCTVSCSFVRSSRPPRKSSMTAQDLFTYSFFGFLCCSGRDSCFSSPASHAAARLLVAWSFSQSVSWGFVNRGARGRKLIATDNPSPPREPHVKR